MRVVATGAGFRRGARATLPLTVGLIPFGLVVGVLAQAQGLSALEQALMSALVYQPVDEIVVA
jgi:predicted branched-subunit amino acid permease